MMLQQECMTVLQQVTCRGFTFDEKPHTHSEREKKMKLNQEINSNGTYTFGISNFKGSKHSRYG